MTFTEKYAKWPTPPCPPKVGGPRTLRTDPRLIGYFFDAFPKLQTTVLCFYLQNHRLCILVWSRIVRVRIIRQLKIVFNLSIIQPSSLYIVFPAPFVFLSYLNKFIEGFDKVETILKSFLVLLKLYMWFGLSDLICTIAMYRICRAGEIGTLLQK